MKKVLLIDDDNDLVAVLTEAFRRHTYSVLTAPDGEQGLRCWEAEHPDLVLLDGNLPQVDGFEVCRRIRDQATRTAVILLTERSAEAQVLDGFAAGADDYLPKPFSIKQLLARMDTVLRRYEGWPERVSARELRVGDLTLDTNTLTVTRGGQHIALTCLEFQLLYCLALNAGHVVPYARLKAVRGYNGDEISSSAVKTHIAHIRQKLGVSRTRPGAIRAVTSVGYRLNV